MTTKPTGTERFSLARWSQRKLESAKTVPAAAAAGEQSGAQAAALQSAAATAAKVAPIELPPVESLTFDSDFTAFLRPDVDPMLKRAALKQLFRDPRFNVMDGLDVYIDDYTKADPIPPDMLAEVLKRFDLANAEAVPPAAAQEAGERASAPVTAQSTAARAAETAPMPAVTDALPGDANPSVAAQANAAAADQAAAMPGAASADAVRDERR